MLISGLMILVLMTFLELDIDIHNPILYWISFLVSLRFFFAVMYTTWVEMYCNLVADSVYAGVNWIGYKFRPQEDFSKFRVIFCSIQGEGNSTLRLEVWLEAEGDNLWLEAEVQRSRRSLHELHQVMLIIAAMRLSYAVLVLFASISLWGPLWVLKINDDFSAL
jgi:hypothetical protein